MEKWHDFYLMLGPSAAALIGLLFVVATLTSNIETSNLSRGTALFMSPTVFHLGVIVLLSGLALAPDLPVALTEAVIFLCGAVGVFYAAYVAHGLRQHDVEAYASDFWYYGVAVGAGYALLVADGILMIVKPALGPPVLAFSLLALLLLMIHNAWDLVSFLAPKAGKKTS